MDGIFSHLTGNAALKKRLGADLRCGTLSHAYVIEGRRGCGKHLAAELIAAAVNCTGKGAEIPCCTCDACRRVLGRLSPDVVTVSREEDKATLGVDRIRALCADAPTAPSELDRKVYIIEEADLMTHQAQNALLLTLEEPPPFVTFLLLAENAQALLETVRSRAPVLRVEPLRRDALDAYLLRFDPRARLLKQNQPEEYAVVLTAADGSIGEALRLLDSKERKALLTRRATVEALVTAAAERASGRALAALLPAPKRAELLPVLTLLLTAVRDLIAVSRCDAPHLCFYPDCETAAASAARFSLTALVSLYEATEEAIDALLRNAGVPLSLVSFSVSVGR